jgi:hypothetical protein
MMQTDRYFEYRSRRATGGWNRTGDVPPYPFGHPDTGDDIRWPALHDVVGCRVLAVRTAGSTQYQ